MKIAENSLVLKEVQDSCSKWNVWWISAGCLGVEEDLVEPLLKDEDMFELLCESEGWRKFYSVEKSSEIPVLKRNVWQNLAISCLSVVKTLDLHKHTHDIDQS